MNKIFNPKTRFLKQLNQTLRCEVTEMARKIPLIPVTAEKLCGRRVAIWNLD